jgi:hypothetical protein
MSKVGTVAGVPPDHKVNLMGDKSDITEVKEQVLYRQAMEKHFAAAFDGEVLTGKVNEKLIEHGFTPDKTLFGNSTCPDEVNRFVTTFGAYWGGNFPLGGLAGIPFTGKTGFSAFSEHMPDDGNLFVLYASHVGINKKGEIGKILRRNMSHETTCCGSAIGAYNSLIKGMVPKTKKDYQQEYVARVVGARLEEIKKSENHLVGLTHLLYEAIHNEIEAIIPDSFSHNIALLGGIQINTPIGEPGCFLVKNFEIKRPSEGYRVDLTDIS